MRRPAVREPWRRLRFERQLLQRDAVCAERERHPAVRVRPDCVHRHMRSVHQQCRLLSRHLVHRFQRKYERYLRSLRGQRPVT